MRELVALALLAAACGGEEAPPHRGPLALLPLAEGNRWVYAVSTPGDFAETVKTQVVLGLRSLSGAKAGLEAWAVETTEGTRRAVTYLEAGPEGVRRHSKEEFAGSALVESTTFKPFFVRALPPGSKAGDVIVRDHAEASVDGSGTTMPPQTFRITWTVEAEESVTVPAGTFKALRIRRSRDASGEKLYWWAPGVGKLREEGQRVEVLRSYSVR